MIPDLRYEKEGQTRQLDRKDQHVNTIRMEPKKREKKMSTSVGINLGDKICLLLSTVGMTNFTTKIAEISTHGFDVVVFLFAALISRFDCCWGRLVVSLFFSSAALICRFDCWDRVVVVVLFFFLPC